MKYLFLDEVDVTPLAGVWIEITKKTQRRSFGRSLPLRECGLKSEGKERDAQGRFVTPLAGVWIEITFPSGWQIICWSLPLRECGLKSAII